MPTRPLRVALGASLLLAIAASGGAAEAPAPASASAMADIAALAGAWVVDLRPSPDAPAYDKRMVLGVDADRAVRGSFYDGDIESGRASASNGRICFAFRTTDGVGPYQTSGCLVGDRIVGQTWAEHRKFVLNWSARRE
jgi:hypothetical protein